MDVRPEPVDAGLNDLDAAAPFDLGAFCSETCARISSYRLPAAFCEDWGLPGAPRFEFCGVDVQGETCEDHCVQSVEAGSDACEAVLPDAIACVVGTGRYGPTLEVPPIGTCFYDGCVTRMLRLHDECTGMRQELEAARELWEASSPDRYEFTWRAGDLEARIGVENEVAVVLSGGPLDQPRTVETLFGEIEAGLDAENITVVTTYDVGLGFPLEIVQHFPADQGCTYSERVTIEDFAVE